MVMCLKPGFKIFGISNVGLFGKRYAAEEIHVIHDVFLITIYLWWEIIAAPLRSIELRRARFLFEGDLNDW